MRAKTHVGILVPLVSVSLLLTFAPTVAYYSSTGTTEVPQGHDLSSPPAADPEASPDLRPRGPAVDLPAEEILFVFAAIADSHIKRYQFDDYRFLKALSICRELLANCVADINSHSPPVDFVVHLGDITDFGTLEEHGCFVGSHAVVILSHKDDMKADALNLMKFFEDESCGQCTPCRNGTEKAVQLMSQDNWDGGLLEELANVMADASICGLGQAAPNPLRSVLKYFPEDLP